MDQTTIHDRIEDLEDNIKKNYEIIKSLEEAVRQESDPRRKEKWEHDIKDLKETITQHQDEIQDLKNSLQIRLDVAEKTNGINHVDIPFVVAAMNKEEASSLMVENNPDDSSILHEKERQNYDKFKAFIKDAISNQEKINEWASHYKENRDGWQPHIFPDKTIFELVLEMTDRVKRRRRTHAQQAAGHPRRRRMKTVPC